MRRNVIETSGLRKHYGDVQVLKSLNLAVPENSIFGFLGPNGAGKTTTMKILLGLISSSGGKASIFGKDVDRESLGIRQEIGYLPQHPVFPTHMTAREVLHFAASFYQSIENHPANRQVEEALNLVGLSEKADRSVRGFSGGERQRLGIAQAQIHGPKLLILDEPAASLDPLGRHDVLKIMENLREKATIFYSTHILDDVQQVSDTVAILNQGRLAAQGPIEDLLFGADETVYQLRVLGNGPWVKSQLESLNWVTDLVQQEKNGELAFRIAVSDKKLAEENLLRRVLAHPDVVITHFQQKSFELEEVFMNLIRRDSHEN